MPFFEHHPICRIFLREENHFGHLRIHFYRVEGLDGERYTGIGIWKTLLTKPFFVFFKLVGSGFGQNTFTGLDRHCGGMRKLFINPFFHIFISELSTCYDAGAFSRKGQAPVTLAEVGEVRAY